MRPQKTFLLSALLSAFVTSPTLAAISYGAKIGVSNIDFHDVDGVKSSSGIEYAVDANWLNYFYRNISIGLNISANRFENQLFSHYDSKHSSIIIAPQISYRILTLTNSFLGVERQRFHDGLSIYVQTGLGYASSEIKHDQGMMSESGAVGVFSTGLRFQTTNAWSFGIEYRLLDNAMWGIGSRDFGIKNESFMATLSYRQ